MRMRGMEMRNRLIIAGACTALAALCGTASAGERSWPQRYRDGAPTIVYGTPTQIDQLNRRDFPVVLDGDAPPQHVDHTEHRAAIGSDYINFI